MTTVQHSLTRSASRLRYAWSMNNQRYPTDLTDRQWDCISPFIPAAKLGGRPRTLDMRDVINAILYIVVTGCQWRLLPHDYPKWQSVYAYYARWRDDGTWQRIHDTLRAEVRRRAGRHKHPTAGCVDSQSVKTTQGAGVRGFYRGKLVDWVAEQCQFLLQPVLRSDDMKGFVVLPRRWVVERTFAWLTQCRRLARDYETLPQSSEAFIYIAMIRLMLRRLTK